MLIFPLMILRKIFVCATIFDSVSFASPGILCCQNQFDSLSFLNWVWKNLTKTCRFHLF
jgi:hypothetical protein